MDELKQLSTAEIYERIEKRRQDRFALETYDRIPDWKLYNELGAEMERLYEELETRLR